MPIAMIDQKTLSGQGWIALLALAAIWGGSFLAFALALQELPFFTVVAHRVIWGALALWGLVFVARLPYPKDARTWAACFVMGALNNVIPFSLIAWGQTMIESGLASILNATTAFFGLTIAAIVFADERFTGPKVIGTSLGFVGVLIVVGIANLQSFNPQSVGQIAILGASLSYALASTWARKTLSHIPPQAAAVGMVTGSSVLILPIMLLIDGPPSFALETNTILSIVYLSLGATTAAYLLYYRVLSLAGSANLMLVTILIVPIAVALGALVLGEQLTLTDYAGFALIALGMIVIDGRLLRRLI